MENFLESSEHVLGRDGAHVDLGNVFAFPGGTRCLEFFYARALRAIALWGTGPNKPMVGVPTASADEGARIAAD